MNMCFDQEPLGIDQCLNQKPSGFKQAPYAFDQMDLIRYPIMTSLLDNDTPEFDQAPS